MTLKHPSGSSQPGTGMLVVPRGSRWGVPRAALSGMFFARRSVTAAVSAFSTAGSEPLSFAGPASGCSGSNGCVHGIVPARRVVQNTRHSTSPRARGAAPPVPAGEDVAGLGEVRAPARAAAVDDALARELRGPVAVREEHPLHRAQR